MLLRPTQETRTEILQRYIEQHLLFWEKDFNLSNGQFPAWRILLWGEVIKAVKLRSVRIPSSPVKPKNVAVEKKPHMLVTHGESFEQVPEPDVL